MKISSKSILSPGRAGGGGRDPPNSLSTSLSRRLRNSGSIKGGASPAMFPTTAKKRGSFENPEPSSPKVTCIGQVRVKSKKKQAKKLRTLSTRHSTGEVSFRKLEHPHNGFTAQTQNQECWPAQSQSRSNQRWVHLPVTICEALRAFGSEFSCLFPCRTERGKEDKMVAAEEGNRQGSCGAVFARWLVAVQDGEGGCGRDIELVAGEEKEEEDEEESVKKPRRHVFEDLEIINDRIEGHKDEARVSICIPPKNALLLMRCRSDPMKMEALTNRSWEPTVAKNEEEDEELVDDEHQIEENIVHSREPPEDLRVEQQQVMVLDEDQDQEHDNLQQDEEKGNVQQNDVSQDQEHDNLQQDEQCNAQQNEVSQDQDHDNLQQDEEQCNMQQNEVSQDQDHDNLQQDEEQCNMQQNEVSQDQEQDEEQDNVQQNEVSQDQEHDSLQQDEVCEDQEQEQEQTVEEESMYLGSLFEEIVNQDYEIQEQDEADSDMEEAQEEDEDVLEIGAEVSKMVTEISETHEEEMVKEAEEGINGVLEKEERVLPECLLMMMYEPKLSMEVSKETWVCSTDFIKRHSNKRKPPPPPPPPPPVKPDGGDESTDSATAYDVMRVGDGGYQPVLQQPARSSCSLPGPPSMATMLEQKLADAVGYEPFVLTRCKSEPMKTAAAKLLPESCVWENRKLERLSRVTFGVGAAGLGF